MNELLRKINITDDDINWVQTILDGISFDDHRRDIIKNMDTVDIQASPGSGKTTVLIAKLAIMAKKWTYSYKGICVLSHTNIARDEIQRRLGNTDVGKKLLRYPHFIGTFHSFFDTYVSLPWLRSQGIKVKIIDSDIVTELRFKRLHRETRCYMSHQHGIDAKCCETIELPVRIKIGNAGPTSQSYRDTCKIVSNSLSSGEFTFNEMLLYAEEAMNKCPTLPLNIIRRFPILFIDEAQDTSSSQWKLINLAFPTREPHICQRYGDSNQAIFDSYDKNIDDGPNVFPNGTVLTIPDSKRFGASIASLANHLVTSDNQNQIEGASRDFSSLADKHTVFLFDKASMGRLIPAYASLIFSCFTDAELSDNQGCGCHVIGMVHREKDNSFNNFPRSVHDYWEDYNSNYSSYNPSPKLLIAYFRTGRQELRQRSDMFVYVNWVSKGLRRYFNMYNNRNIPVNSDAFIALCHELPDEKNKKAFRKSLSSLIHSDITTESSWQMVTEEIIRMASDIFGLQANANDFLRWENPLNHEPDQSEKNIYKHVDTTSTRSIQLYFGSIHSVKGCTHLSTMVVETFWHDYNITSLLPLLCRCTINKGKQNIYRMKCHYVAFTRARALLCVAMPKGNVKREQINVLKDNGWRIDDLT